MFRFFEHTSSELADGRKPAGELADGRKPAGDHANVLGPKKPGTTSPDGLRRTAKKCGLNQGRRHRTACAVPLKNVG